jgi:AcrR family transcriptional regulator
MAQKPKGSERVVAAALALAERRGWREISLADIAAAAGVSLAELYPEFPSKTAILAAFSADIDRQVLAGPLPDPEESARDRLFDVIMRRFDALAPRKPAIAAMLRDLPGDPLAAVPTLARLALSMRWMLEAAGLSASGLQGVLRVKGLAAVYLAAFRVWLADDSPDHARTMAALDRGLRRAEGWVEACARLPGCRRGGGRAGADPTPSPSPGDAAAG